MKFHCLQGLFILQILLIIIRNSIDSDDNSWDFMCQYLSKNKDSLFDSECVNAFLHVFTKESFYVFK